jgi:hypothetical protein
MRVGAGAVVGAALVLASTGWAGEVYRWTDAQGVLHIADVPPPQQHGVQTQTLPEPQARAATAAATPVEGTPVSGTPAAGAQAPKQGPAQVVITEKNEESLGDTRHGVSGTVENKGGETARDVAIAVHVISPAQGDDCLSEEIEVASALKPGEKAEFSADFDHPCFRGPTQVDLRAQWQ